MYVVTRTAQENYLVNPTLARRAVLNALRDVSKRTTGNHYKMKHNTQGDLLSNSASHFILKMYLNSQHFSYHLTSVL